MMPTSHPSWNKYSQARVYESATKQQEQPQHVKRPKSATISSALKKKKKGTVISAKNIFSSHHPEPYVGPASNNNNSSIFFRNQSPGNINAANAVTSHGMLLSPNAFSPIIRTASVTSPPPKPIPLLLGDDNTASDVKRPQQQKKRVRPSQSTAMKSAARDDAATEIEQMWEKKRALCHKATLDLQQDLDRFKSQFLRRKARAALLLQLHESDLKTLTEEVKVVTAKLQEQEAVRKQLADATRDLEIEVFQMKNQRKNSSLMSNFNSNSSEHTSDPNDRDALLQRLSSSRKLAEELSTAIEDLERSIQRRSIERDTLQGLVAAHKSEINRLSSSETTLKAAVKDSQEALRSSVMYRQQIPELKELKKANERSLEDIKKRTVETNKWFVEQIERDERALRETPAAPKGGGDDGHHCAPPSLIAEIQAENESFRKMISKIMHEAESERVALQATAGILSDRLAQVEGHFSVPN